MYVVEVQQLEYVINRICLFMTVYMEPVGSMKCKKCSKKGSKKNFLR